jgi:hypothetical protein
MKQANHKNDLMQKTQIEAIPATCKVHMSQNEGKIFLFFFSNLSH